MAAYRSRSDDTEPRRGELALAFQEILTITVRLRRGQAPTSDSGYFRTHVKQLLFEADQRAREAGYSSGYVKLAVYACIAFLDESILEGERPLFPDWAGQPLQEEVFGDNVAGENFFRNLQDLLDSTESEQLADLLEVYLLCLLLGFRGIYSSRPSDDLQDLVHRLRRKVDRIRGGEDPLAPPWPLPADEVVPRRRDTRTRLLGRAAAVLSLTAIGLWALFMILLGRSVDRASAGLAPATSIAASSSAPSTLLVRDVGEPPTAERNS